MSNRNKKLEIIMIIISSNSIFPHHLKKLQRMSLFVNIYICWDYIMKIYNSYLKYDFMKNTFI